MNWLLTRLFGRLPIGWLQLSHNKGRLFAAVSGVAFANLLVFMQLGIMGALNGSTVAPYAIIDTDIILSSQEGNTLTDSEHIARVWMLQSLGVAGVADASPLYIGNLPFTLDDGSSVSLLAFGVNTTQPDFVSADIAPLLSQLTLENTALLDEDTRGMPAAVIDGLKAGAPFSFEASGETLTAVGTMNVGGGFLADGMMMVSDQTFLRFFGSRSSAAPDHILIKVVDGVSAETVAARLADVLPALTVGSVSV